LIQDKREKEKSKKLNLMVKIEQLRHEEKKKLERIHSLVYHFSIRE
jgi:hypothetical protein